MKKLSFLAVASWLALGSITPNAAELDLKLVAKEAPGELDASIRALLQKQAVQLLEGDKARYEFWFVTELALTSKPASAARALDGVKSATLLGAMKVSGDQRDYRDDELHAGVYTVRFALQPQDGNHLGSSEFLYFAVLTPAKLDTRPDGITDYKALVKASSRETSTDHPVILSLRPVSADDGDLPKLTEPAPDHKSVRVKLPARAGDDKTSITFDVVHYGKGKK